MCGCAALRAALGCETLARSVGGPGGLLLRAVRPNICKPCANAARLTKRQKKAPFCLRGAEGGDKMGRFSGEISALFVENTRLFEKSRRILSARAASSRGGVAR